MRTKTKVKVSNIKTVYAMGTKELCALLTQFERRVKQLEKQVEKLSKQEGTKKRGRKPGTTVKKVKGKRGRPAKKKEVVVQKKRGRKPKATEVRVEKKRGRKPGRPRKETIAQEVKLIKIDAEPTPAQIPQGEERAVALIQ